MSKYIIVNVDPIQKRIDELEKEISVLKLVLSNSIPLIPKIEDAFIAGCRYEEYFLESGMEEQPNLEGYMSEFKLDI